MITTDFDKLKILVIDDDEVMRLTIKNIMKK